MNQGQRHTLLLWGRQGPAQSTMLTRRAVRSNIRKRSLAEIAPPRKQLCPADTRKVQRGAKGAELGLTNETGGPQTVQCRPLSKMLRGSN